MPFLHKLHVMIDLPLCAQTPNFRKQPSNGHLLQLEETRQYAWQKKTCTIFVSLASTDVLILFECQLKQGGKLSYNQQSNQ